MKNYAIQSGSFTTRGNFTGYTAMGERVHIHKAQMEAQGWKTNEDLKGKFPFYAIGDVKQIGQLDENNLPKTNADGSPVLVERLTAMSVYATKEQLIAAHVDNATLSVEIAQKVTSVAKAAGLSEESLKSLLAVA